MATSKTTTKTKGGARASAPDAESKQIGMTFAAEETKALQLESGKLGLPLATLVRFIVRRRYKLSNPLPEVPEVGT